MDATKYFLLPDGRLRAGWRLVLFLSLSYFTYVIASGISSIVFRETTLTYSIATLMASTVAATWIMMRFVEKQSFVSVGLWLQKRALSQMALGLLGGTVLAGAVTLIEGVSGSIRFEVVSASNPSWLAPLLLMSLLLLASAAAEELLFRGYGFQRLVEGAGAEWAIGFSSAVFGGLHMGNPHATPLSTANTMLAGILLSLAYLKTRALWFPIGIHFSWNWSLAMAGLPVSGLDLLATPWRTIPTARASWLHGGDYGPEGGAIATIALVLGSLFLVWSLTAPKSPEK
jgi:membrane protease YdiL (CAAX protease family)